MIEKVTQPPIPWEEFTKALKQEVDPLLKIEEGGYETNASVSLSDAKSKGGQTCVVSMTVSRDLLPFPIIVHFHNRDLVEGYLSDLPSRLVCQFILEDSSDARERAQSVIESLHWASKARTRPKSISR